MATNWIGLNEGINSFMTGIAQRKEKENKMRQAVQMYMFQQKMEQAMAREKATMEAQIKQQYDPEAKLMEYLLGGGGGGGNGGQPMPDNNIMPSQSQGVQGQMASPLSQALMFSRQNMGGRLPQMGGQGGQMPLSGMGQINRSMPVNNGQQPMNRLEEMGINRDQLKRAYISNKLKIPYEALATPEERERNIQEKTSISPILIKEKNKRAEELINLVNQNKNQRKMIEDAIDATKRISTGALGSMSIWSKRMFDPNNPMLSDWQKIKIVLTDAQLMNVARTKGAISDREMELFSKAAANDDIASTSAMEPVFAKLLNFMNSEEKSKINSYKKIYKEDPLSWPELEYDSNTQQPQPVYSGRISTGLGYTIER